MPLNEKFELFFTHPSTVYICPALLYKICTKKFNVLVYKKPEEIRRKPFLKIFRDSVQHFHSSVVCVLRLFHLNSSSIQVIQYKRSHPRYLPIEETNRHMSVFYYFLSISKDRKWPKV